MRGEAEQPGLIFLERGSRVLLRVVTGKCSKGTPV